MNRRRVQVPRSVNRRLGVPRPACRRLVVPRNLRRLLETLLRGPRALALRARGGAVVCSLVEGWAATSLVASECCGVVHYV